MLVWLLSSFLKLSKEVLPTPVFFPFIALWVWLPEHKQRSPTFQCHPVLSFSVNSPRAPYLGAFWWCPCSSLHLSESVGTTPNPSQSASPSCSALARWVLSWAPALKRKKGKRLWETENWYLTDCRLRNKCSWLQPCAARGPFGGSRSKARQCEIAEEGVRST